MILIGIPTGKRSLGRPRIIREDNIRMGLKEIGINTRNWVDFNRQIYRKETSRKDKAYSGRQY